MSTVKKLASQTAVYGLSTIVGRLLNYMLVPLHTRVFEPEAYGTIGEMYSYVSFLMVLLMYGMETAFFRFAEKSEKPDRVFATGFISVAVSAFVFMGLVYVFSPQLAAAIRHADHPEYVWWFGLILGFDAMANIPFAMLRRQNRPMRFALIKNTNIFIQIALNLYFLMLCPWWMQHYGSALPFYDASVGVGYVFIANLVASLLTLPLLLPEIRQVKAGFDSAIWKQMVWYALPLLVVGLGGMVNETLDRAIMKYLVDDPAYAMRQVGIYSANYKLSILMSLFIQAFRFAAEPFFFKHAKETDSRQLYAKVMDYFVIVCFFIFLLVTLYIDVFKVFVGEKYYEGLRVVPILLLANLCLGIYYNQSIWYRLSDQTGKGALISFIGAGITIVLNLWWIPLMGYMGSAWATLVCYFSMMVISYFMGQKYYPIPYHLKHVARFGALALLLFFAGQWLGQKTGPGFVRMALSTVLLLVFVAAAFLFERKNKMLTSRS